MTALYRVLSNKSSALKQKWMIDYVWKKVKVMKILRLIVNTIQTNFCTEGWQGLDVTDRNIFL